MRRLAPIAAFALFLAVPLLAQHGGGHAGGGHSGGSIGHGGSGGGHFGGAHAGGGHAGGGHVSGGMHSGSGSSRGFSRGPSFSQRIHSNRPYLHDGSRNRRVRTYGLRNNCYGYGCRRGYYYPWAYGGYYDPYWWYDSDSSYDDDYNQNVAAAAEMNRQSLEEQQMMRREEADGDHDLYARSPAARQAERTPIMADTVLVFRDQHQQEIENYAIVGQTLWNFTPQHTEKIPLADLDLAATTKANDDRGLTFRLPASSEGQ